MEQSKIWEYYQSQAGHDRFALSTPRYRFIARKITSGSRVLNIGVGRGGLEALLVRKGIDISSLDPSQTSIDAIKSLGLGEKAKVGYSQNIPFLADTFDVVVMSEVLEHLDNTILNETLFNVRRVLKNGGMFIGTVPANEKLQNSEVICPDCKKTFHRWGHVQTFSLERMQEILKEHSFGPVHVKYAAFPDWQRRGIINHLKSVVRWALGSIGNALAKPNIYFKAYKQE